MPTMLPPDLEQFLRAEVTSGKYSSTDEALGVQSSIGGHCVKNLSHGMTELRRRVIP